MFSKSTTYLPLIVPWGHELKRQIEIFNRYFLENCIVLYNTIVDEKIRNTFAAYTVSLLAKIHFLANKP